MNKIIALNHKMNLNYDLVSEYIEKINKVKTDNKIIIIPSYLYISTFIKNTKYDIGSQNLSNELNGAFTGEVSSTQLNSIGVKYSLVGHSERRNLFHETDEIINEKTRQCLNHGITPIICVGETLSEHNNDETLVKINNQINKSGMDFISIKVISSVICIIIALFAKTIRFKVFTIYDIYIPLLFGFFIPDFIYYYKYKTSVRQCFFTKKYTFSSIGLKKNSIRSNNNNE